MYEIEVVSVYRVKGDDRKYRTYSAAVNRLAWKIVFEKYGDKYIPGSSEYDVDIVSRPIPFGHECNCGNDSSFDGAVWGWQGCPVHDRSTGYFRRVHNRLIGYIMFHCPMPRLAGQPGE